MFSALFYIVETFLMLFALSIFGANYPFAFVGTFGLETIPVTEKAEIIDKFREISHAGGYQERFHLVFSVKLDDGGVCRDEAIINASQYYSVNLGDKVPVVAWRSHCFDIRDSRWSLPSQLFIWIHGLIGFVLLFHLTRKVVRYLAHWEVRDEPTFRAHD